MAFPMRAAMSSISELRRYSASSDLILGGTDVELETGSNSDPGDPEFGEPPKLPVLGLLPGGLRR